VRCDKFELAWALGALASGAFHNVVLSPGPGSPHVPADAGAAVALLRAAPDAPILGVCLGCQALAVAHGGAVGRAAEPVHGRLSAVRHSGHALFAGIPSGAGYRVVRYHSLVVDAASLPPALVPLAWAEGGHAAVGLEADGDAGSGGSSGAVSGGSTIDTASGSEGSGGAPAGALMALAHATLPHYGVQYHPESVATGYGARLLANFRDMTLARLGAAPGAAPPPGATPRRPPALPRAWAPRGGGLAAAHAAAPAGSLGALARGALGLFEARVLGAAAGDADDTFWLDSASAPDRGRFSFMGGRGGPLWRRIRYALPPPGSAPGASGEVTIADAAGGVTTETTLFWPWLAAELAGPWRCRVDAATAAALPFDFWGGLVGYLGYELKAESGGAAARAAPTPAAAFLLADRLLAVDHADGAVYAVALHAAEGPGAGAARAEAEAWVADAVAAVAALAESGRAEGAAAAAAAGGCGAPALLDGAAAAAEPATKPPPLQFALREPRPAYERNVRACLEALRAGASYELCLTTRLSAPAAGLDAWELYKHLRRINPAPYGAWLRLGGGADLALCCSSPERFLRGGRGGALEARPIKGTARRHADPAADAAAAAALAASEKDRAENLMIVDLLRNDLGACCWVWQRCFVRIVVSFSVARQIQNSPTAPPSFQAASATPAPSTSPRSWPSSRSRPSTNSSRPCAAGGAPPPPSPTRCAPPSPAAR
jgi:para-aminobenzoate synthetase